MLPYSEGAQRGSPSAPPLEVGTSRRGTSAFVEPGRSARDTGTLAVMTEGDVVVDGAAFLGSDNSRSRTQIRAAGDLRVLNGSFVRCGDADLDVTLAADRKDLAAVHDQHAIGDRRAIARLDSRPHKRMRLFLREQAAQHARRRHRRPQQSQGVHRQKTTCCPMSRSTDKGRTADGTGSMTGAEVAPY